jgi:hypothetical protein
MNENLTASKPAAATRTRSLGYWGGFTAFLFVVLLALFTWVVQRRVAQYESLQQAGGHHLTATKVCLTDRIGGTSKLLPSISTLAGLLLLLAALFGFNPTEAPVSAPSGRRAGSHHPLATVRRLLPHLFCLPPPSLSFAR